MFQLFFFKANIFSIIHGSLRNTREVTCASFHKPTETILRVLRWNPKQEEPATLVCLGAECMYLLKHDTDSGTVVVLVGRHAFAERENPQRARGPQLAFSGDVHTAVPDSTQGNALGVVLPGPGTLAGSVPVSCLHSCTAS